MNIISDQISWKEIIKDIINPELIERLDKKFNIYIGVDPTNDSLHIGHYLWLNLIRLIANEQNNIGFIFVIGDFTATIGDPSGKKSERKVLTMDFVRKNSISIENQLKHFCKQMNIKNYDIVRNSKFYNGMSIIEMYQKYGKLFNINDMLSKDMIKNRLTTGISYTEFSYQVFQGIDFLNLFEKHNVNIQIGGSDQYGNIVSGVELIRKIHGRDQLTGGLTINLLVDENGNKIGKSDGKPIWVDPGKTNFFDFYQSILNLSDEDSINLVKKLTIINKNDFISIHKDSKLNPKIRIMQNYLAKDLMTIIYGDDFYEIATNLSKSLFNNNYDSLTLSELNQFRNILISFKIKNLEQFELCSFILENKILKSKRETNEFLNNGAIKINSEKITTDEPINLSSFLLKNRFIVLSVGKKNKYLLYI